jgi:hypothetical protein
MLGGNEIVSTMQIMLKSALFGAPVKTGKE